MLKCVSCPSARQHQETHRVFGTKKRLLRALEGPLELWSAALWRRRRDDRPLPVGQYVGFVDSRWLSVVFFYYQGRIFEQLLPNENRFCVLSPSPTYATTMAETKKNSYF